MFESNESIMFAFYIKTGNTQHTTQPGFDDLFSTNSQGGPAEFDNLNLNFGAFAGINAQTKSMPQNIMFDDIEPNFASNVPLQPLNPQSKASSPQQQQQPPLTQSQVIFFHICENLNLKRIFRPQRIPLPTLPIWHRV